MNAVSKVPHPGTLAIPEAQAIEVLRSSLYPGARPESVKMVLAWCKATGRDPMKKPIHIVPMWVKDIATGKSEMRDVLMPGIGTYRSDAASTGHYAGKGEPEFGPEVTRKIDDNEVTFPQWCKVTVYRLVGGEVREFAAREYWLENYASGKEKKGVNDMWRKRPYGQLAKCAESQALRMAFPDETGNTNTAEEMDGKTYEGMTIEGRAEEAAQARPQATLKPTLTTTELDETLVGDNWDLDAPVAPKPDGARADANRLKGWLAAVTTQAQWDKLWANAGVNAVREKIRAERIELDAELTAAEDEARSRIDNVAVPVDAQAELST